MIGVGKSWVLVAVATSSTVGGAIGWGLGKGPKSISLDSSSMWCRTADVSKQDNPTTCLKYDGKSKSWLYGQVVYDHGSSKASSFSWNKAKEGKLSLIN